MVLLLCIDGNAESGIILGGLKHVKRFTTLTKEAGLHLEGEYNGLNWKINKDGELTISFKSPTDSSGKVLKPELSGSQIKIEKDGSFEANTNYNDKLGEKVRLDKTKQQADISARKNASLSAGEQLDLSSGKDTTLKTGKDLLMSISGAAKMTAKSLSISIEGNVEIKGKAKTETYESNYKVIAQIIDLAGDKVKVGAGASFAVPLGPQLIDWLKNHTHPPIPPLVGGPVLPPIVPPPPSILSNSVMVKE
jgi:hypothetical protein